jgi:ubiquinone/menaquinone biosynthesis C-methylase UbiE
MRGDRDEKAWAFESVVEKALWWMLRSTLGRVLRLMLRLAEHRRAELPDLDVALRRENALASSLADGCADRIVCGFGVKTLSDEQREEFASEIARLLRPGGAFSLVEVSVPRGWWLKGLYMLYLKHIIPIIGWVLLLDFGHSRCVADRIG